jgi:hypothetical protein
VQQLGLTTFRAFLLLVLPEISPASLPLSLALSQNSPYTQFATINNELELMESIYKWVEPAPVRPERPPLYHSKHDPKQPASLSTLGKKSLNVTSHATLGTDKLKLTVRPDSFLKKGDGFLLTGGLRE